MDSKNQPVMRLNKYLALQLGTSRREADELIEKGSVKVDGQTARLGQQVLPDQVVTLNNKPVQTAAKKQYIALNKPVGYVCSRREQGNVPTIYKLLPSSIHHLKPVGRLDKDSSGLILLTNDGDFAHQMTHPKFYKEKIYEVTLSHSLSPGLEQKIEKGVQLEDGVSKFLVKEVTGSTYRVTMHEGRNRQIRRTFTALGYTITKLHRTNFGSYRLETLAPGEWRDVTPDNNLLQ